MSFNGRWHGAAVIVAVVALHACGGDDASSSPLLPGYVGATCDAEGNAFIDSDGDGYAASREGAIQCERAGALPPPGYTGSLGDCDDSNAELTTLYLVDADGDGASPSAEQTVCGPSSKVPVGAVASSSHWDCSDNDPNLVRWGRRDLDRDGFGAGPAECLGLEIPSGYVETAASAPDASELIDCDDASADVHPRALELWSDLLDTDCDGYATLPEACLTAACGQTVEVNGECATTDLAVTALSRTSSGCRELSWVIVVANLGRAPVSRFTILVDDGVESVSAEVAEPLGPGAQRSYKLWGRIDGSNVTATASSATVDCQPSNNQRTLVDLIGASCTI